MAAWLATNLPPFHGTSSYDDRRVIAAVGGDFDKIKKQWYAKNEDVLFALLSTEKWVPIGCDANSLFLYLSSKRQVERDAIVLAATVGSKRKEISKKEVLERNLKELGVSVDEQSDVEALETRFSIRREQIQATLSWDVLGPRAGTSAAGRLLRGLKHNIIDPADVLRGVEPTRHRQSKQPASKKKTTKTSSTIHDPYSRAAIAKLHAAQQQEDDAAETTHPATWANPAVLWVADTRCEICLQLVSDQFVVCDCLDAKWFHCSGCRAKRRIDGVDRNATCPCMFAS